VGGGGGRGIQQQELSLAQSQEARAGRAEGREKQLFDLTFPGMQTAESYYQTLASGDPTAIQRAIAPATERINMASQAAQEQIRNEMPRGGTQQLAIEEAGISRAGQVGNLATQAYTGAFPALAALAGQGIGLSVNELSNAIASAQGAGQTLGAAGQQAAQGKASTSGLLGSLATGAGIAAACPVEGTPILMMDDSERPIEQLRAGDVIRGVDGGEEVVLTTPEGSDQSCVRVSVEGETIECSVSHTLLREQGGYVTAERALGAIVKTAHSPGKVDSVETIGARRVYRLRLNRSHTYRCGICWCEE